MRRIPAFLAAAAALALPGLAAAEGWTRPPAAKGFSYPDCYCTNRGERVSMGGTACIRVGGEEFTARCAMSLNTPVWRKIEDGCVPAPGAALGPAMSLISGPYPGPAAAIAPAG